MSNLRKIQMTPSEMSLLSAIATYAYKSTFQQKALEDLQQREAKGSISPAVVKVGSIVLAGAVPPGTEPAIEETAKYYLELAESYHPNKVA